MALSPALQKKLEAMSPEQLKEVEDFVEECEKRAGVTDDEAGEAGESAEANTVMNSTYRSQ